MFTMWQFQLQEILLPAAQPVLLHQEREVVMLNQLKDDNDRFIVHLRAGIVAADNAHEPAISNFLQDTLGKQQKYAWMLRSITK